MSEETTESVIFVRMYISENGDFLALDLGGTNFRVLLCRMRDGHCESTSRNYNVPNKKLHGPASDVCLSQLNRIHLFVSCIGWARKVSLLLLQ